MFISSVINLICRFSTIRCAPSRFGRWGSLSGTGYAHTRILSLALLLRYSLDADDAASAIERAINRALEEGIRTGI